MSARSPITSRRGVLVSGLALGLGAVGVGAAGCELQELDPREPLPAPGPDGPPATETADPDSDVLLVAEVVALIASRSDRVDAIRRRHGRLRRELGPLARMHRAHLDVLDPDVTARPTVPEATATAKPAKDRRRVLQAETTLQQQIARAAERAEAGQFAKLLGSISASIAQHLLSLQEGSS